MECAICLESVRRTRNSPHLDCGHQFHTTCFNKWQEHGGKTCPMCRDYIKKSLWKITVHIENTETGNNQTHSVLRHVDDVPELENLLHAQVGFELEELDELREIFDSGFFGLTGSDLDTIRLNTE